MTTHLTARHAAVMLVDEGGYDLSAGEMNPAIYTLLAGKIGNAGFKSAWEPFSSPKCNGWPAFDNAGVRLIAHGMERGEHVFALDSTIFGPAEMVGGVVFHPPYFGSTLLSNNPRDLSAIRDWGLYEKAVSMAAGLALTWTMEGGLVGTVSRVYRYGGRQIRLDKLMLRLFEKGVVLEGVWMSTPDVVHVFRRV